MSPARWILRFEASILRKLMDVGMFLHRIRSPRPLAPSFRRSIPATVSPRKGDITLLFYTPSDYERHHSSNGGRRYPVLVNFHGVVDFVHAVVVSVDYRLAPQYPFPTAVEDGADAILYLLENAVELSIDTDRIGVSGFSVGGNLAFTVPLKLRDELRRRRGCYNEAQQLVDRPSNEGKVALIISWYPATDFATNTREERRATNLRPDTELPKFYTTLFDASYLYPPRDISLSDFNLSPGVAPDEVLMELPDDIIIYVCEWDGLRAEAERFKERLLNDLGKRVLYKVVRDVPHAWDKSPNPFKGCLARQQVYEEACIEIKRIFDSSL